jgi:hypothetical protein
MYTKSSTANFDTYAWLGNYCFIELGKLCDRIMDTRGILVLTVTKESISSSLLNYTEQIVSKLKKIGLVAQQTHPISTSY